MARSKTRIDPALQNPQDRIQCRVCGNWFRNLSWTHLKLHGMTTDDYRRRFKVKFITSPARRMEISTEREGPERVRLAPFGNAKTEWRHGVDCHGRCFGTLRHFVRGPDVAGIARPQDSSRAKDMSTDGKLRAGEIPERSAAGLICR